MTLLHDQLRLTPNLYVSTLTSQLGLCELHRCLVEGLERAKCCAMECERCLSVCFTTPVLKFAFEQAQRVVVCLECEVFVVRCVSKRGELRFFCAEGQRDLLEFAVSEREFGPGLEADAPVECLTTLDEQIHLEGSWSEPDTFDLLCREG